MQQADVRSSIWIDVSELPWPLRFDFLKIEEDDGRIRWGCLGFELGAPFPREALGSDPTDVEVTAERLAIVWQNFSRYRRMAENMLIPTPEGVERAIGTREAMRRRRRERWTPEDLVEVAEEWRGRRNESGVIFDMAQARGIDRRTLRRQLEEAERRGLIPEGLPRRRVKS